MKCPATSVCFSADGANVYIGALDNEIYVVFHPDFLTSNKPILGLDYEEFVRAATWASSRAITSRGGIHLQSVQLWASPPSTNLSGFRYFMSDLIENPAAKDEFVLCSRSGGVMTQSGMSTPGRGAFRSLSETGLKRVDAALSQKEEEKEKWTNKESKCKRRRGR
ncbi:hypothetical protein C8J56DRAFT_1032171 [Mycena floridula]|nr:hypothetical protein C8J56DRAFT_1032171 [Mycena floridula]